MAETELRRSTLERKDRDELSTIAKSLDLKVPSRARKSEIVDLILAATTADAAETGDADESGAEEPTTYHAGDEEEEFDFGEAKTPAQAKNADDDPPEKGNRRQRRRGRGRNEQRGGEQGDGEPVAVDGFLDLRDDGYGFLRVNGFRASRDDAYVSVKQVRQFGLRKGDRIVGTSRPANRNEKNPALLTIESINWQDPESSTARPEFDELTAQPPTEQLTLELEGESADLTSRAIDLLAPIGKGQRALVVAPADSGASSTLVSIARSIETNASDVQLLVLLIDERPEDITTMQRALVDADVSASGFDRPSDEHVAVAEITIERAKRMVEIGQDVVVVCDGLTRMARANTIAGTNGGKAVADGVDAASLHATKRFFGAGRNIENGGSLTVIATVSADQGRAAATVLDAVEGGASAVITLDADLAARGVFPAIDATNTTTRQLADLLDDDEVEQSTALRTWIDSSVDADDPTAASVALVERLADSDSNADFLRGLPGA